MLKLLSSTCHSFLILFAIYFMAVIKQQQQTTTTFGFSWNYNNNIHRHKNDIVPFSVRYPSTGTSGNIDQTSKKIVKMSQRRRLTYRLSASYTTEQSTSKVVVQLSTGISMTVYISQPHLLDNSNNKNKNQILLVLHGSFHSGWCWMEYWGKYFTSKGYIVIAPCWRGTGDTFPGDNKKKVKILDHVADLQSLLQQLPSIIIESCNDERTNIKEQQLQFLLQPPIVITHSFGGIVVMKYLEQLHNENTTINKVFSGIVPICSVPPSGNGPMIIRYMKRSIIDSYKITVGFALKRCLYNIQLCRELFFDTSVNDTTIIQYQTYFTRDSVATIDLFDLSRQLPSKCTTDEGVANFMIGTSSDTATVSSLPPIVVMAATDDFIVDTIGIQETATYFGNAPTLFIDSPHDIMLGSKWENGASILYQWLQQNINVYPKQ